RKGSLLDVGTGTGFFLKAMKSREWEVTGTEKSPQARIFAKEKLNLDLLDHQGLFGLADQRFDVITLWHVLEHIHRLNENMEAYFRLLKPNGKLIIAVPNRNAFDARVYRKFWAAWDV